MTKDIKPSEPQRVPTVCVIPGAQCGYLNVVFHGLYCFFNEGDKIIARVPKITCDMSDPDASSTGGGGTGCVGGTDAMEHVYLAGNWLGEQTFTPEPHMLTGVKPGRGFFDPTKNLMMENTQRSMCPGDALYAEITLPRPQWIYSLQCVPMQPTDFTGDTDVVAHVKAVATLQVFRYWFDDNRKVKLNPHPFSAADSVVTVPCRNGGRTIDKHCSLHVFAEPDRFIPAGHVRHAFATAMQMFQRTNGDPISLSINNPPKVPTMNPADVPAGLRPEEMRDFFLRGGTPAQLGMLAALGVRQRRGDDLNGVFVPDSALDEVTVERCGSGVG